ncbi:MAG: hypothetical protein RL701_4006 [Pseudomonadota bacterium]
MTGWNPDAAFEAFTDFEDRSKRCDVGIGDWVLSRQGFRRVLEGTHHLGDSCMFTAPTPVEQAAAMASCIHEEGAACLPDSLLNGYVCAARNATDGKCWTEDNCQPGLYCNKPRVTAGTCAARLQLDAKCDAGSDCASLYCKGGVCVTATIDIAYCLE